MVTRRSIIALSIVALILGCLWLTGTRGGLEYFSPYTLQLTVQSEFTLLDGELPFYRSSSRPVDNALVSYVRDAGFVAPEKPTTDRQLLVFHWNRVWKDGDSELYGLLHSNREQIIEWCNEDPDRAKIYWSEGFRHLRANDQSNVYIGESILSNGWRAKSVDELKQQIASIERDAVRPLK
jgi:hypothetical protein